jgi:predicted anti-sigma-YlaC factor YlaD
MNRLNRPHLSSEEFDVALFSVPSAVAAEHLASCAECTGEFARLRAGFGHLRVATAALAAEDLHELDRIGMKPRRAVSRFALPRFAMACAALAIAIGLPAALHQRTSAPVAAAPTQSVPQISDEALLTTIQSDLNTSVPAPLLPLTSTTSTTENQKED